MKLLSVLLLSYRNLSAVFVTLDSVFRQDYPALELVFSDDASPDFDAWRPRIEAYVRDHRPENLRDVLWVSHPENVGTVRNINDAIRASHGDYLFSVSPDDELANDHALSDLVRALEESGRDIIFGRMRGVTPEGRTVDHLLSCESDYDLLKSYSVEQTRNRLFSRNFLPAPAKLMTRKLFEENGLYPESVRLIEDYPYWLTLTKNGVPFAYLDEVVLLYRLNASGAGVYGEAFMADMFVIYDQFIFPYDRRFGPLQGVYNRLKRSGLAFYLARARWPKFSVGKRFLLRIRYAPFFALTAWQAWRNDRRNRQTEKEKHAAGG